MGKKKGAPKKRAIQQAKVNSTTNDIKGRAVAFQEVSLLKDMQEAPKKKRTNIPRHTFLQTLAKDEMKYPHPDLFFPGEMKFRNTFGRWDPVRKKLPPLSQLLKCDLHAVTAKERHAAKEPSPARQLSTEEARFLNYSETEKLKRGERGDSSIFDSKLLKEMDYKTDDELQDEVSEQLSIPFHRRISMTRGRGEHNPYRRDSVSTRRSSVGSVFSRQGSQRSLNSSGSYSTYDPMQQYQNINDSRPYHRESIGSQASYSSSGSSPHTHRSIAYVPVEGHPTIRDLYGEDESSRNAIDSSDHDMPDLNHAGMANTSGASLGEEQEYEGEESSQSTASSFRSTSTSSLSLHQQIMDPTANFATPVIQNRKALVDHNEEEEYDDDQDDEVVYDADDQDDAEQVSLPESVESYSTSSSFSSRSYLEDSGRYTNQRSSSSHTSALSDSRRLTSDSDPSYLSAQSDDFTEEEKGFSTISENRSVDVNHRGVDRTSATNKQVESASDLQHSSNLLYLGDGKTAEDAVAALHGLEPFESPLSSTAVASDDLPANDNISEDDYFGMLATPTLPSDSPGPSLKHHSRSTTADGDSRSIMPDRSLSFSTMGEARGKSRLPRGVAQIPSWWVATVPHEAIEEHSSDESSESGDEPEFAKEERMRQRRDVERDTSPVPQSRDAVRPTNDTIDLSPSVAPPKRETNISVSSMSPFVSPMLVNSTSTELSSIEQGTSITGYRSEVPPTETIPEHPQAPAEVAEVPTVKANELEVEPIPRSIDITDAAVTSSAAVAVGATICCSVVSDDTNELETKIDTAHDASTVDTNGTNKEPIQQDDTGVAVGAAGADVATAGAVVGAVKPFSVDGDEGSGDAGENAEMLRDETNAVASNAQKLDKGGAYQGLASSGGPIDDALDTTEVSTTNAVAIAGSIPNYVADVELEDSQSQANTTPLQHPVSDDRAAKEKLAADLFTTIIGGSPSKQGDIVAENLVEKAEKEPDNAKGEQSAFAPPCGTKFTFFSVQEQTEPALPNKGTESMVQKLQPLEEAVEFSPSLVVGPTECYDDLETRWQEGGDCNDVPSGVYVALQPAVQLMLTKNTDSKQDVTLKRESRGSDEDVLSAANLKKLGEDIVGDDGMRGPEADSSGSNCWIIKSSEWKAPSNRKKKQTENRKRRGGIGQRIMGGFQDEAREAHVRKQEAIRPPTREKDPSCLSVKKLDAPISFNSSRKQKKEGRRGFKGRSKPENNGEKKSPWYRGFLSWKKQIAEKFEGGQVLDPEGDDDDDDSISVYSETASLADNKMSVGVRKMWRQDLHGEERSQRRSSWSASSNASVSGDDNDFFDYGDPSSRRSSKRRGSRNSITSNNTSMDIDEFLKNEGMPNDLVSSGDEGGSDEKPTVSEVDSSAVLGQQDSTPKPSDIEVSSPTKDLPAFLQAKSEADQSTRDAAKAARVRELEDNGGEQSEDVLDVFKELDVVAEAIQLARGSLKAPEKEEQMPILEAHSVKEAAPDVLFREPDAPLPQKVVDSASEAASGTLTMPVDQEVSQVEVPVEAKLDSPDANDFHVELGMGDISVPLKDGDAYTMKPDMGDILYPLKGGDSYIMMQPGAGDISVPLKGGSSYMMDPGMVAFSVPLKGDPSEIDGAGTGIMIENMEEVTLAPLKDAPEEPRRKFKRRGSTDTLESWEPPIRLEERWKQRESQQPNPEIVQKWKSMIARPKADELFREKKNRLDHSKDGDAVDGKEQSATSAEETRSNVGSSDDGKPKPKSPRTPLSSSKKIKNGEKSPDENASKASSKSMMSQASYDSVEVKSADLPPLYDATVDEDSSFASNTSDEDALDEHIAVMEHEIAMRKQQRLMKELLNDHRRRSFCDDGELDDGSLGARSDFSDEVAELLSRDSMITGSFDDDSTVVSFLSEEDDGDELVGGSDEEGEYIGPSAMTIFLARLV